MTETTTNAVHAALAAAQAEFGRLTKQQKANTGKYSYAYADLAAVLETVRDVLSKHQLALVQDVESSITEGGHVIASVTSRLLHPDGSITTGELVAPIIPDRMNLLQTMGSAITYMRRYQALGLLGLAPEDDDGASAGNAQRRQAARQKAIDNGPPVSSELGPGKDDDLWS
jgi:hypothetical protein